MKTIAEFIADNLGCTAIAEKLGLTKSNAHKLMQQELMRQDHLLGKIDPADARRRYIDDAVCIDKLALLYGTSVIMMRRYLQAHEIHRDRGHIYRAGTKIQPRKGKRVPGSQRHPDTRPRRNSPEDRENRAAAKRGKRGAETNHWKGGVYVAGPEGYMARHTLGRWRYEHREVASRLIGRKLTYQEQVHHINMVKKDNRPENLLVILDVDHTNLHRAMRRKPDLDQVAWLRANAIWFIEVGSYA